MNWQDDFRECFYFDEDGKVLGRVDGAYSHSRWTAWAHAAGGLGEYMTKEQAKKAVERAAASIGAADARSGGEGR